MKSKILNFFNAIYWFFYRLTPRGKKAYMFHQAFVGIQESKRQGNRTKWDVIGSATKLFKTKRIITFHKGKSITKPKKSNHEVIETVKHQNADQLKDHNIKITKTGKFKTV